MNIKLEPFKQTEHSIDFFERHLDLMRQVSITKAEVAHLMKNTKDGDYDWSLLKGKAAEIKADVYAYLMKNGVSDTREILKHHPLFVRLFGNPLALITAANCYLNHDKTVDKVNRLSKVYEMMTDYIDKLPLEKRSMLNNMKGEKEFNDFSLEIATRMKLGLLTTNNDNLGAAKDLLFFIGCMPGGIKRKWLKKMWDAKSVKDDLPSLLSFKLVTRDYSGKL